MSNVDTATAPDAVNGLAVEADEPATFNMGKNTTRTTEKVRRLLLADGSTVLRCADPTCRLTKDDDKSGMSTLLIHVGRAHGTARAKATAVAADDVLAMTIADLLHIARSNETLRAALRRMTEDRNEWRQKYRDTEARLARAGRALNDLKGGKGDAA